MAFPAAVYSNLALFPTALSKERRDSRKAAVPTGRNDEEAQLKRNIERANTVLDRLEARQSEQAAQMKRLQKRKNATCARIARIEDEILAYMDDERLTLVTGIRCTMRAQPAAASLEVIDQKLIPKEYFRQPAAPPSAPDKVAIKAALAANEDLAPADWGCKLVSKISLVRR
jgi:hypothetical protein